MAGDRTAAGRALEELVLLRLNATNPALRGVRRLFDDAELAASTDYLRILEALDASAAGPATVAGTGAGAPDRTPPGSCGCCAARSRPHRTPSPGSCCGSAATGRPS